MIKDLFVGPRYTEDELMVRLKFFIGIILGLTLFGIVFVVLYSLIFVTQPMNGMSPVDNKFFELIIPIATFLTGTLSGIMLAGNDKDLRAKALDAANSPPPPSSPTPSPTLPGFDSGFSASGSFGGTNFSFNKPAATPAAGSSFAATPAASFGAPAQPMMSSTGKPMPVLEDDREL